MPPRTMKQRDAQTERPEAVAPPAHEPVALARRIGALSELVRPGHEAGFECVLSDVWGVLHNGRDVYRDAGRALGEARRAGAAVVLITNSPRPRDGVAVQLDQFGVPREAYDDIVTSGDVTRDLIESGPRAVFHLGPARDLPLFEGTGARLVAQGEAEAVVCSGLVDDETETPADYAGMLAGMRERDLPMIVANPDIVVERGDRLIWCAGALARDYRAMGGETRVAGKPHAPIYAAALERAARVLGRMPDRRRTLALGDGMPTDVRGAVDAGLPLLFIAGGIHAAEYGGAEADAARLAAFLREHGVDESVVGWMPHLA